MKGRDQNFSGIQYSARFRHVHAVCAVFLAECVVIAVVVGIVHEGRSRRLLLGLCIVAHDEKIK